nr:hypothetical protein [Gordonia sp. NB41Y]
MPVTRLAPAAPERLTLACNVWYLRRRRPAKPLRGFSAALQDWNDLEDSGDLTESRRPRGVYWCTRFR